MERISEIYLNYIAETKEYNADSQTDGVKAASKALYEQLGKITDKAFYLALEADIVDYSSQMEEQGFALGFKYATQLFKECV